MASGLSAETVCQTWARSFSALAYWFWPRRSRSSTTRPRRQLEGYVARGLKSVKIYLAYKPTLAIGDADLIRVLELAARDIVVMAHCDAT